MSGGPGVSKLWLLLDQLAYLVRDILSEHQITSRTYYPVHARCDDLRRCVKTEVRAAIVYQTYKRIVDHRIEVLWFFHISSERGYDCVSGELVAITVRPATVPKKHS